VSQPPQHPQEPASGGHPTDPADPAALADAPPRRSWRRALGLGTAALVALVAVAIGAFQLGAQSQPQPSLEGLGAGGADLDDAEDAVEPIAELYAEIMDSAVEAPDREALVEAAMEAMLDELDDDYAQFVPAEGFGAFQDQVRGEFSGVGMQIEETPEGAVVTSVFPDTPAEEGGIESGWRIEAVDGEDVSGVPVGQIAQAVQGEEGTEVDLELRDEDGDLRELTLERAEISIPTVQVDIEDGVGVVTMLTFTQQTGEQFERAIEQLEDAGVEGMVLDLRNNGGGTLNDALDVLDALLDGGEVLRIVEASEEEVVEVDEGATDLPLVVMVNEASASASEVVAGALQDRGRAELVGETTFGKGTIQVISQFSDGSGAKLTTAEFFTPDGSSIEGVGLTPDTVLTAQDDDEQLAEAVDLLREQVARTAALSRR